MYRKIVVCIDDSPLSDRVTRVGADLACRYNSDVVLLSVVDPARLPRQPYTGLEAFQMLDRHSSSLSNTANRLSAMLHGIGVRNRQIVQPGRSVETILSVAADESADLIVIGARARGRLNAWLNSDLWSEVSHKAGCNVLRVTPSDGRNDNDPEDDGAVPQKSARRSLLTASLSAL